MKTRTDPYEQPKYNARGELFQPGDLILDRYMPNASTEEREAARERLRRLALLIARVQMRLHNERIAAQKTKPEDGAQMALF